MRISLDLLQHTIDVRAGGVASLVVENARLFRDICQAFFSSCEEGGEAVLFSENGDRIPPEKAAEVIQTFVPFSLNTKTLLASLVKRVEKLAVSPEHYLATMNAVGVMTQYVRQLTLDLPHDIECDGLSVGGVLKACGLRFSEEDLPLTDALLGYMRLVREFVGERLYVLINSRVYFSDEEMQKLLSVCQLEQMKVLLIDGVEKSLLPEEDRLLVDKDLCELTKQDDIML